MDKVMMPAMLGHMFGAVAGLLVILILAVDCFHVFVHWRSCVGAGANDGCHGSGHDVGTGGFDEGQQEDADHGGYAAPCI